MKLGYRNQVELSCEIFFPPFAPRKSTPFVKRMGIHVESVLLLLLLLKILVFSMTTMKRSNLEAAEFQRELCTNGSNCLISEVQISSYVDYCAQLCAQLGVLLVHYY